MKRTRQGFTLVELLVVIGIIALLISILLPSLNKARNAAVRTTCIARMRELGNASMLYAAENRGYLPPLVNFFDSGAVHFSRPSIFPTTTTDPRENTYLARYLALGDTAKRYICPALEADAAYSLTGNQSYSYNRYLGGYLRTFANQPPVPTSPGYRFCAPYNLGRIKQSSFMALFMDRNSITSGAGNGLNQLMFRNEPGCEGKPTGQNYHFFGNGTLQFHGAKTAGTYPGFGGAPQPRYKAAQTNIGYADGSVRTAQIDLDAYPPRSQGSQFFIDPDHPSAFW